MLSPISSKLNKVIPGVTDAYNQLCSTNGVGLHTSNGRFYNHTLFGRDASMAAKFTGDFDHEVLRETIISLARYQGTRFDTTTQEEPGRIHHELRDFRTWKANFFDRIPFFLLRNRWEITDRRLLTYFALDTTASFIDMVHKYASNIDTAILRHQVTNLHGETQTIGQAVTMAAEWIMEKVDDNDLIGEKRHNPWSLPFQTFQDSLYARRDGSLANCNDSIIYVEVQALSADALLDASHMMHDHKKASAWRDVALRMNQTMLEYFDSDDGYLASAIDSRGQIDVANISPGWILNTALWDEMPAQERQRRVSGIVERLFSEEFLTPVGFRTRSKHAPNPIVGSLDYHGSETVWPMFGFMVAEGLRRHRLYDLADQVEYRLLNGLNATGDFVEFHVVQRSGKLIIPVSRWWGLGMRVQMKPEKNIAFSVVPSVVMARHVVEPPPRLPQQHWQVELEEKILKKIKKVKLAKPDEAIKSVGDFEYRRLALFSARLFAMYYFFREFKKLPR